MTLVKLPAVLLRKQFPGRAETEETVFCPSGEAGNTTEFIAVCEIKDKELLLCPVFQRTEDVPLCAQQTVRHLLQTERNRSIGVNAKDRYTLCSPFASGI